MFDKVVRNRVQAVFEADLPWPSPPSYLESVKDGLDDIKQRRSYISLLQILFDWLSVILVAVASYTYFHWFTYVLAVIFIATRQHSMLMLGHEGAHYFLSKNKKVNDFLAEVFLSWPFLITMHGFRRKHIAHHKLTATADDPEFIMMDRYKDYHYPKTKVGLFFAYLRHLLGIMTPRQYFNLFIVGQYSTHSPWLLNLFRLIFYLAVFWLITIFGIWAEVAMYWFVPALTVLVFLLYFRLSAEHFALPAQTFYHTRTVIPRWWEKVLFSPVNIGYHIDHHLFPFIPYYNLPELHKRLMEVPEFRQGAHVVDGYLAGFVSECLEPAKDKKVDR